MCFLNRMGKKGQIVGRKAIEWIIYIAIIVAVGFSIRMIFQRASG